MLDRHTLVMEQIRELKESFVAQRDALSTTLPDGRRLFPGQYEALEKFASNNRLDTRELLSWHITIEGGVITGCDFVSQRLKTLEGLESVGTVRRLNVSWNEYLPSLKGISTKELEVILAQRCDLIGDLSELSGADKLKKLDISDNINVSSLAGISTAAIEVIKADNCERLSGDHTFLSQARYLKHLNLDMTYATLDSDKFGSAVEIAKIRRPLW